MFSETAVFSLRHAQIKSPESISFHTVNLRPSWFVDVDVRKFGFTACSWRWKTTKDINARSEIEALSNRGLDNPHKLLAKACWQLADNFEDDRSFTTASFFRKLANQTKRLQEYRGFKIWSLHWWYGFLSGYGERWWQAFAILVALIVLSAVGFMSSTFRVCVSNGDGGTICEERRLGALESFQHSLATVVFYSSDFRKAVTERGENITLLLRTLTPIQAALIALAVRRKFMR